MSPKGPCFEVGPRGYLAFEAKYVSTQRATALGVLRGVHQKIVVYDREGRKWSSKSFEAPFKKTWWRVLLANTVYNPGTSVTVHWRESERYELAELRQAYSKAVDKDDDILTQFVEAEELKAKIAAADTFDALIDVYRWMEAEPANEKQA